MGHMSFEASTACKIASSIDLSPPRSRKMEYGNNAETALRFDRIESKFLASTSVLSSWVMRLETCSTRALAFGQKPCRYPWGTNKYLSSQDVMLEISHPRSIAIIVRQSKITDVGGGGFRERE